MPKPAPKPIPDDANIITPQFWFKGNCKEAIEWYTKALNAKPKGTVVPSPDGTSIWHAMLKFGDSNIMLADATPNQIEAPPGDTTSMSIWFYTEDCDAVFNSAIEHGAKEVFPVDDMFWGDRVGKFVDPFGHVWAVATHKWIPTEDEMQASINDAAQKMAEQK